jgi:hypothetical protein
MNWLRRRNLQCGALLACLFIFMLVLAPFTAIISTGEAAVANDGTDAEVRPPVENPQPPPQQPKPPVTIKPPTPPPASGPALSITDVRVRNEDKEGNGLSEYKISFDYNETRWISYYVRLVNNTDEQLRGKLGIRYIQPDGKLKQNSKSPPNYTFEQDIDIQNSLEMTGGWGKATGGTFEPGRHRVEFWWAGKRIHQLTFAVSEPEVSLKINTIQLRNESKDSTPLSDFGRSFARDEIQYITFHLKLENTTSQTQTGKIGVKFFGPDGELLRGSKSPEGYTLVQSVSVQDTAIINNGWGNSAGNYYEPGRHRIEFWWNDKRIGQTYFDVN